MPLSFASWASDPGMTSLQITALQSVYYLVLGGQLMLFSAMFDMKRVQVSDLFSLPRESTTKEGLVNCFAHVCSVPFVVQAVVFFVDHASKVLDFVMTMYAIHVLLAVAFSSSFPSSVQFWVTLAVEGFVVMAVSEFAAIRRDAAEVRRLGGTLGEVDEGDTRRLERLPVPTTVL